VKSSSSGEKNESSAEIKEFNPMLFFFWKFWITLQQELCIPYQLADTTSQY
jgi:hypothetical protein